MDDTGLLRTVLLLGVECTNTPPRKEKKIKKEKRRMKNIYILLRAACSDRIIEMCGEVNRIISSS